MQAISPRVCTAVAELDEGLVLAESEMTNIWPVASTDVVFDVPLVSVAS